MNALGVYRDIWRGDITKSKKDEVKTQLLGLLEEGRPPQAKELLVKLMRLIVVFRKAVTENDDGMQLQTLQRLKDLVNSNHQNLPTFNDILMLMKNRSSWYRSEVPRTIIEILKRLDQESCLKVCREATSCVMKSGLINPGAVKNKQYRQELSNNTLKAAKQKALIYFKTTVQNLLRKRSINHRFTGWPLI